MDDTARPHDQVADEPDAVGVADADGSMHGMVEPTPVEQDAPVPRLELEADPFAAPSDPVAAPEEAEDAAPSLDDMVSELATDETPARVEVAEAETGPEVETVEGEEVAEAEEAEEGETEAAAASWRDDVATEAVVPTLVRQRLSTRLPSWIYGGAWVVFAGVMTYLMWPLSADPFVGTQYYSYFVLGCAALLALGPFLGLAVWLWGRTGATDVEREGLVRAVSLRAATWMAAGVALMWICLYVLDLHRTGVIG
jgi:hypothetical protein